MIKVQGNKVHFSGKEERQLKEAAFRLGLSYQDAFTGILWEHIMRLAREGAFLNAKKVKK